MPEEWFNSFNGKDETATMFFLKKPSLVTVELS